ncbi:hypothetical protein A3Q56_03835 [Intoshia linei]|uniref:Calponin-homology (CH) domain-containing protein n=1 Tax=Intoshia linei TaxID=1819745 RepID=A0A177B278_9BILA|nr:hypothetical protein A3Q56_03835 [Intoshia linei]
MVSNVLTGFIQVQPLDLSSNQTTHTGRRKSKTPKKINTQSHTWESFTDNKEECNDHEESNEIVQENGVQSSINRRLLLTRNKIKSTSGNNGIFARMIAAKSGDQIAIQQRLNDRFSSSECYKLLNYMQIILEEDFGMEVENECVKMSEFLRLIMDGRIFIKFVNKVFNRNIAIHPPVANEGREKYKIRERIMVLIESMKNDTKLKEFEVFDVEVLMDNTNLSAVLDSMRLYCTNIQEMNIGPSGYWPVKAKRNERKFSAEKIADGKKTISLQMGTNEMATNKDPFGNRRNIT